MNELNEEWENFCDDGLHESTIDHVHTQNLPSNVPKCSDIYISTKTKIGFLSKPIDLYKTFWQLPIIPYHLPKPGIVKKQMKFNSKSEKELQETIKHIDTNIFHEHHIINRIVNPEGRISYKDVRKISIGLCKKDITSYRCKKKGAFYNCFAIILRINHNDSYKEITWGETGSLGMGGNGGLTDSPTYDSGGGGGGGYYGGGGGAGSNEDSRGDAAGGGGGSSYVIDSAENVQFAGGLNEGNGKIIVSYVIPGWICFRANTMIQTDTGEVPIQLLKAGKHKIRGDKVVGITKTIHNDNEIVKISKDALFENVPNQDLYLSKQHQVIIRGNYIDAVDLVNFSTITLIPYEDEVLYNVLMNNHQVIKANNTSVETLDPRSEVARLFKKYVWKSDKKKNTVKTIKK